MNIFRKFAFKKNTKGVIGESSDSDLQTQRLVEVRSCEWPHTPFMEEAGILQEFAQYAANAGLTDFIIAKCEQYHLLTNTLCKVLISFLGIILLRCSLIYTPSPIRYRLLSSVKYACFLLMVVW